MKILITKARVLLGRWESGIVLAVLFREEKSKEDLGHFGNGEKSNRETESPNGSG